MQIRRGPHLINFGARAPAGEKRRNIGIGSAEKFFPSSRDDEKKRRHRWNKKYVPPRPLDQAELGEGNERRSEVEEKVA